MYWALLGIGGILALVGSVWLWIVAFKESVWWGLGSIFVPFVSLIFALTHWEVAKTPFLIALLGGIMVGVSIAVFAPEVATPNALG